MIPVTKPFLPPQADYNKLVDGIWERQWLTNHGPLVTKLEEQIREYCGVPHFLFLNNGTVALQLAIKALGLSGEIITTPFSYVATTSSIVWENCTPVFADIHPDSWNIDPDSIRKKITSKTTGIIATHVYGNPCDVEAIDAIAKEHNLKVIYDAAHGFGTSVNGKSIFSFGDISTASFHATKLFHTTEGGGVFCNNDEVAHTLSYMRNFGHKGQEDFWGVGINGKNSEFHAAMGLANFPHIESILNKRKHITNTYNQGLNHLFNSGKLQQPKLHPEAKYNCAYYAILLPSEKDLLAARDVLQASFIYPRRYFFPTLSALPYVSQSSVPMAENYSPRVLCLPSYHSITDEELQRVISVLSSALK